jgi:hypothetical protein
MHLLWEYLDRRSRRKTQVGQATHEEIIGHLDNITARIAAVRPPSVSKESEGAYKEDLFVLQLEKIRSSGRRAPAQTKHTNKSGLGMPVLKSSGST